VTADVFSTFARKVAHVIGTPIAFAIALAAVVVWGLSGPLFGFSDSWQLVINTSTTIVTFLVVFLIQSTQNKDAKAVHLKLDELIHVIHKARNRLIDAEELTDAELDRLEDEFRQLRDTTRRKRTLGHQNVPSRVRE
jgi:low affinity Fe/Cu permease